MEVDNPKLVSTAPQWRRFPGFSLLFDNPGGGLAPFADGQLLACNPHAPGLELYGAVADWLAEQDTERWRKQYGFCATTVASYHVTAFDGLNPAVLDQAHAATADRLTPLFAGLPDNLADWRGLHRELAAGMTAMGACLPLDLRVARVRGSPGIGVVIDLEPADRAAAEAMRHLEAARDALADHAARRWGWAYRYPLTPHLTIGYFANAAAARPLEAQLDAWDVALRTRTAGLRVTFESVGLYAFTDMIRFYRIG